MPSTKQAVRLLALSFPSTFHPAKGTENEQAKYSTGINTKPPPGKAWNAVLNSKEGSTIVLTLLSQYNTSLQETVPSCSVHKKIHFTRMDPRPALANDHKAPAVLIPNQPQTSCTRSGLAILQMGLTLAKPLHTV